MITLFRNIRKSLIASKSASRYFLYAIGEITLVVIGILFALQINNWNESRKSNLLAISNLESLKEDLLSDLNELKSNEEYLNLYESSGVNVWNHLYNEGVDVDSSRLNDDFLRLQLFREFLPSRTAYENLINTGGINLLQDSKLQKLLNTYYREEPFDQRSKEQRNSLSNAHDPFRIQYIPSGMLHDYLSNVINNDSTYLEKTYHIEWERLREDKDYKNLLDQILAMRVPSRWRLEQNRKEIHEILGRIDQLLKD